MTAKSYQRFQVIAMAIDPIHVGTGGARLGRVDLTIVRDPVTRVAKIPGSSLAGVYRSYAAMAQQENNPNRQLNLDFAGVEVGIDQAESVKPRIHA